MSLTKPSSASTERARSLVAVEHESAPIGRRYYVCLRKGLSDATLATTESEAVARVIAEEWIQILAKEFDDVLVKYRALFVARLSGEVDEGREVRSKLNTIPGGE